MPPVPRGLVYVSDRSRGIRRVRRAQKNPQGRKAAPPRFDYFAPSGRRIRDTRMLERIARLAIPPAYEDVWICPNPRGHLQATGRDARGRKQYRYHEQWRETRDNGKFARMIEFGAQLPRLRRRLKQDLALPGLDRKSVV